MLHLSRCRCVGCSRAPESLTYVSSSGLMSLVPEAHPAGSINAVQISSRPICFSLAAFLHFEIYWI
ncbi:hypothetical protein DVQ84_03260 [Yersinia enterocolitica]|nr:hypothetical protein [Yersinia enterocolitica]QBQ00372.1 hypothetical protein YEY1_17360 [Yersinia enterocolitica subsp. palearctica]EKN4925349.1 hypothetical protein [Yersinia enterocolitica]EKN4929579.1 hypothetical protein [Yersinia enterocolitica]EKN5011936.1 hypothetical protein [Yersinia enterocolitica]